MNAQIHDTPALDAGTGKSSDNAFASVTIWSDGEYFLQIHYGYFNSWEDAEDFASAGNLALEERSNALFLTGPHGDAFVPDRALQVYRSFSNPARGTYDLTLDDFLEVASIDHMRLQAIGSQPVQRSRPVVAQAMSEYEFAAANAAANDAR